MNALIALKMIAETTFRPFTEFDWWAYQGCKTGCKTENPLAGRTRRMGDRY